MNELPKECLETICSFLSDSELRPLHFVNKNFNIVSKSLLKTFHLSDFETNRSDYTFVRDKVCGVSQNLRIRFEKRRYNEIEPVKQTKKRCIPGRDITAIRLTRLPSNLHQYDLTQLRRLEVNPFVFRHFTVIGIENILNSCHKIDTVIVPRLVISEPIMAAMETMPLLRDLRMSDSRLPAEIEKYRFPINLTNLDCSFVHLYEHNLHDLTTLTKLNVTETCLSVPDICKLSVLTNLKCLDISWNMPGSIMSCISNLRNLVSFKAMMSRIGFFDDIRALRHLEHLQILNLENCDVLSEQVDWISESKSLTKLYLGYNAINHNGTSHICKCKTLELIDLSYNALDDTSGDMISTNEWTRLSSLDISGNSITDLSARDLANMHLKHLDMTRNFISDLCIDDIYTWSKVIDLKCYPQRSCVETSVIDMWADI